MFKRYWMWVMGYLLVGVLAVGCGAPVVGAVSDDDTNPDTESHGGEVTDYVSLVDALRAEGVTVEPADPVDQPFFEPTGQVIEINGQSVQVFEFESTDAQQEANATISPDGSSVGTSMMTWIDQPNFWASERIIVLYVGSDQATIDLLTGVLGEPITEHSSS